MAGILTMIFRAEIDVLAFVGTNYMFSKSGCGDPDVEHKH